MAELARRFVDLGIRLGTWIVALLTAANTLWFFGNCISAEFRMLRFDPHGYPVRGRRCGAAPSRRWARWPPPDTWPSRC